MAYLKDVAAASRVSIRTVARALKGSGYVESRTREKVLAAATRLGYRPNLAARSLKTSKSYEVAVLAWSMDELHVAKIAGLEQTLRKNEYALNIFFERDPQAAEQLRLIDDVANRRPAAVALFPTSEMAEGAALRRLAKADIPYIVFDWRARGVDSVRIDRQQGVYEAVLYLAAKGRQRIAYLGSRTERSRLEGYHRALEQLKREPQYIEIESGREQFERGREAARAFAALPQRPDAVQAYTDEVALGFLAGLHDLGLRVPGDVALVGFDDRRAAALSSPPLTTVAQPNWELGVAAAEILLRKIKGEAAPPGGWSRDLPTKLVIRESSG